MKKILIFLNVLVLGVLMIASCNLNEHPKFDENEAFVAFDKSAINVKENGGTIQVPVTLASISGIATTISYEAVDGSAVLGTDYELLDGAGTLTFSAEGRTQYISVNIIERAGEYTGDLKFSLKFKSTGDVKAGAENSCVITIQDNDHPLASILSAYTASGTSYFNGDVKWEMVLEKEPTDAAMVWIFGLAYGFEGTGGFYGTVTSVDGVPTTITIPIGQINAKHTTTSGDGNIYLYGLNNDDNLTDEGNITVAITDGGATLTFDSEWGPSPNVGGTNSYYDLMYPGITCKKKK